jgi:sulfoxide reductase heme-binding subunit YedZ
VPFLATVKPLWVGLGTVAFDLLVAIVITGLVRQRIGTKLFRFIHWFTYAMWPIALLHAIGNGSDAGSGWFIAFALVCSLTVLGAVIWRLSATFIDYSHVRGAEVNR